MSLPVHIKDGQGTSRTAGVTTEFALKVSPVHSRPSDVDPSLLTAQRLFRAYFTSAGGSSNLAVDGSATPVAFSVPSLIGQVIWVSGVRLVLESSQLNILSSQSRGFGSAASSPGLSNGLMFVATQLGSPTSIFLSAVKQLNGFLDYADKYECLPGSVASGVDYLSVDISFDVPIVLPAGTQDSLTFTVQDNLTTFSAFRVIARGWKESI